MFGWIRSEKKTQIKRSSCVLNGRTITIERKKMKSLRLRIRRQDGAIVVSAPLYTREERILAFVRRHEDWLQKHLPRVQRYVAQHQAKRDLQSIRLWGRTYPIVIQRVRASSRSITWDHEVLAIKVRLQDTDRRILAQIEAWQRKILAQRIAQRAPRCEAIVGQKANEWRIKKMRSKWGTCHVRDRRIWLALALVRYPKMCLESVMIHELVHLIERGHTSRFYARMDRCDPLWRRANALLYHRKIHF